MPHKHTYIHTQTCTYSAFNHPSRSLGDSNYDVCVVQLDGESETPYIGMHNNSLFAAEGDTCSEVCVCVYYACMHACVTGLGLNLLPCLWCMNNVCMCVCVWHFCHARTTMWINTAPAVCSGCMPICMSMMNFLPMHDDVHARARNTCICPAKEQPWCDLSVLNMHEDISVKRHACLYNPQDNCQCAYTTKLLRSCLHNPQDNCQCSYTTKLCRTA